MAPEDGEQTGDDGGDGHDFWSQAQAGAFFDCHDQVGAVECVAAFGHFAFHGFIQVHDHDDTGLDGGAEEGDVADPDRDAEIAAEQPLKEDTAGQGKGDGEDDVRGFLEIVVHDVEQEENDEQRGGYDESQGILSANLVFVLSAPFDGHAGW